VIEKVNLAEKFDTIEDLYNPKIAGEVNDFYVKLGKLKGDFVWHHHENEDELFLVTKGQLTIMLRDQDDIVLNPGEFVVIPKGVEHNPVSDKEVHCVMFEPKSTLNTGNIENERTVTELEVI
jgi:mannose-6-phosphate isomerase-like protein (cupin superfamily)